MKERIGRFFSAYNGLIITFLSLLLAERVITFLFGFFLSGRAGEAGLNYNPLHFHSPSLTTSFFKFFAGVSGYFGIAVAFLLVLLLFSYFYLFMAVFPRVEGRFEREVKKGGTFQGISLPDGARKKAVALLLLTIFCLFVVKTIYSNPLEKGVSAPEKFLLAGSFYLNFNRAIVAKTAFHEEKYRNLMFEALKRDRDEYVEFADTRYWAYFATKDKTRLTMRDRYAASHLYSLFEDGVLIDDAIFTAYELNRQTGNSKRAVELIKYIYEKYPENSEYAKAYKEYSNNSLEEDCNCSYDF